ncbi:MAG: hypothetical protein R8G66_08020 [Cytophagales bacterium]|nr:hypothetical protein [Cytophagales bacterium]
MKPIHIILTILIIGCVGSVIYAQQQRSEAFSYQMQVTKLQTTLKDYEADAYKLKEAAQMAASDARKAMNMAQQQAEDAEVKIRQLEKSLKNCKVGR